MNLLASIPFTVEVPSEMFTAGIYDYSHGGGSLLNLVVYSAEVDKMVAMAT